MRTEKWNLTVLRCKCKRCGREFDSLALSEFLYGPLLLRSASGHHLALLDTVADKVFDEASKLVEVLLPHITDEMRVASCIHKIFGVTCDPAPDGSRFGLTVPVCTECQSTDVSYGESVPLQLREVELPAPTHKRWKALTPEERKQMIAEALRRVGCL